MISLLTLFSRVYSYCLLWQFEGIITTKFGESRMDLSHWRMIISRNPHGMHGSFHYNLHSFTKVTTIYILENQFASTNSQIMDLPKQWFILANAFWTLLWYCYCLKFGWQNSWSDKRQLLARNCPLWESCAGTFSVCEIPFFFCWNVHTLANSFRQVICCNFLSVLWSMSCHRYTCSWFARICSHPHRLAISCGEARNCSFAAGPSVPRIFYLLAVSHINWLAYISLSSVLLHLSVKAVFPWHEYC